MALTVDQLARIASAGGGFRVDAKLKTVDQLARLASAASTHQARIEIFNTSLLTVDQLARLASAGKGSVFFVDLT
jgi:DNA replication protein